MLRILNLTVLSAGALLSACLLGFPVAEALRQQRAWLVFSNPLLWMIGAPSLALQLAALWWTRRNRLIVLSTLIAVYSVVLVIGCCMVMYGLAHDS